MKKILLVTALLSSLLFGCETKTQTGALTGAALGVGAGALIGGGSGALIGGAAGAVTGALVGSALDQSERDSMQSQSPRTLRKIDRGDQLSIDDVKNMSKAGVRDDVIISQIQATGSTFTLSASDIIDLKNSGVSQRVINAMIRNGS